jgi:hypothetical protein
MMNQDPILENPYASDPAMPEKIEHERKAEDKDSNQASTPTPDATFS